ncbi:MAG: DUF5615 family PIN-like protein [Gemmataceae bacterium]|nr:DUF5615 family PIN-like protein [Gemmataceae bacterium]
MPCFSGSSQSSCQFRAAIAAQIWALMVDFPVSEWPKTLFFPCRIAVSLVENAVAPKSIVYFCDEDVPEGLMACLLKLEPGLAVHGVGESRMPPKGTPDPELLRFAQTLGWTLLTRDKRTMPKHVADHLAAGHHTWGVFILRHGFTFGELADHLIEVWSASEPADWQDRIEFIPWVDRGWQL